MRLINVETLQLEDCLGPGHALYATLSHAWDVGQEVTLQDWQAWLAKGPGWEAIQARSGFTKILGACEKTKEHDLKYLWVDTNCIDKTSSAELSEAINSMFAWYAESQRCFVYLADYPGGTPQAETEATLRLSRWFTRGWTLQELLAPRIVTFYSASWDKITTREDGVSILADITGLDPDALRGTRDLSRYSVAARMSWASRRQTTRIEDMAYCLLGIFDINMPLLYGEGHRAFLRLQEEILKVSEDQSIFAWEYVSEHHWKLPRRLQENRISLLAPSPACFRDCGSITTGLPGILWRDNVITMTNVGLALQLPLLGTLSKGNFYAVLKCRSGHYDLCIPLTTSGNGEYRRHMWPPKPLPIFEVLERPKLEHILVPRSTQFYSTLPDYENSPGAALMGRDNLFIILFAETDARVLNMHNLQRLVIDNTRVNVLLEVEKAATGSEITFCTVDGDFSPESPFSLLVVLRRGGDHGTDDEGDILGCYAWNRAKGYGSEPWTHERLEELRRATSNIVRYPSMRWYSGGNLAQRVGKLRSLVAGSKVVEGAERCFCRRLDVGGGVFVNYIVVPSPFGTGLSS